MSDKNTPPGNAADSASSELTLRQRAEAAFRERAAQSPENPDALSPEATQQTLHELRVHQIELEMQNEELRRAHVELDASRAGYFDLYHLAPVGYCTLSGQGLILQANLTAATQLGVARGPLAGQPLSRFILKEDGDNYHLLRKKLIETGEPQSCELRMVKHDGTQFWAHLASTVTPDAGGLPVIRVVMSDVTEMKRAAEAIKASLHEKEVLLREIHHRVKNNLQIVSSLLNLQTRQLTDPALLAVFAGTRDRVRAMAAVHELLYESGNFAQIDLAVHLRKLARSLASAYAPPGATVRSMLQFEPVTVDLNTAVPVSLIANELIINALKYAFAGRQEGALTLGLHADGAHHELRVADDGPGLPAGLDPEATRTLGLRLVRDLTRQIGGQLQIDSTAAGTCIRVRWPARLAVSEPAAPLAPTVSPQI